jgi:hypothetical protein
VSLLQRFHPHVTQTRTLVTITWHVLAFFRYPCLPFRYDISRIEVKHLLLVHEVVVTSSENILPATHQQHFSLMLLDFKNGPESMLRGKRQLGQLPREFRVFRLLLSDCCSMGIVLNTDLEPLDLLRRLLKPGLKWNP